MEFDLPKHESHNRLSIERSCNGQESLSSQSLAGTVLDAMKAYPPVRRYEKGDAQVGRAVEPRLYEDCQPIRPHYSRYQWEHVLPEPYRIERESWNIKAKDRIVNSQDAQVYDLAEEVKSKAYLLPNSIDLPLPVLVYEQDGLKHLIPQGTDRSCVVTSALMLYLDACVRYPVDQSVAFPEIEINERTYLVKHLARLSTTDLGGEFASSFMPRLNEIISRTKFEFCMHACAHDNQEFIFNLRWPQSVGVGGHQIVVDRLDRDTDRTLGMAMIRDPFFGWAIEIPSRLILDGAKESCFQWESFEIRSTR